MRILITAGGTEEPIDGVRYITNFSTGRTGAALFDKFSKKGWSVTLLTSIRAVLPESSGDVIKYRTFSDLEASLKEQLKSDFDVVIHCAAVSDYSVAYLEVGDEKIEPGENGKIDSSKPLKIILKNNIKLINSIKSYSKGNPIVIAFKLTKGGERELITSKINSIFSKGGVDYVVHNDLTSITKDLHINNIYNREKLLYSGKTKDDMGANLIKLLETM